MSDTLQNLARLLPLLDMAYKAEQMKMAKVLSRIRNLKTKIEALDRPQKVPSQDIDAATMAGADLLWETWAEDRKVLINRELALAYQDREAAKEGLAQSLSKLEAAKQVHRQAALAAKQLQERRSSW